MYSYKVVRRPIVIQYGLWDQIRVDKGREWILMLYIQETLAHLRCNTSRPPHLQSTSKQVCTIMLSRTLAHLVCMSMHVNKESYSGTDLGGD